MSKVDIGEISLDAITLDLLMVHLDYLTMGLSEARKKLLRFDLFNKFFSFGDGMPLSEKFKICDEYIFDSVVNVKQSIKVLKEHGQCYL